MKKFIFVLIIAFTLTIISSVFTKAEAQKGKGLHKTGWTRKKKNVKKRTVTVRADNGHIATKKFAKQYPDRVEKVTEHPKKKN